MTATLIDLGRPRRSPPDDAAGLRAYLLPVVGEQFLFARVGYADELAIHFGTPQDAKHPKLRAAGVRYGSFVLSLRGSAWLLKSGPQPSVYAAGVEIDGIPPDTGRPVTREEIEAGAFVEFGTRVAAAVPFRFRTVPGYGLELALTDGTTLIVFPVAGDPAPDLPPVADWELTTPRGVVSVGPGAEWKFDPAAPPAAT